MAPEREVKRNSWLSWSQVDAKMGQVGAKVALSCATWRQDGPKMANLRAFLEASRQLFEILDAKPQIAKPFEKPNAFSKFFNDLECLGEQFSPILRHLGTFSR